MSLNGISAPTPSLALVYPAWFHVPERCNGYHYSRFGIRTGKRRRGQGERNCSLSRPAVSEKRLVLTSNGNIRYQLKTPYCNGTTHVVFELLDFITRLAALMPKQR